LPTAFLPSPLLSRKRIIFAEISHFAWIGNFVKREDLMLKQAVKLSKYCSTKFVGFMHSLAKASQDATAKTCKFVPVQDFTPKSDIDWGKSIPEIDQQFYKKYQLSAEEVAFIESMIKPMA
jgi:hypothetical protein